MNKFIVVTQSTGGKRAIDLNSIVTFYENKDAKTLGEFAPTTMVLTEVINGKEETYNVEVDDSFSVVADRMHRARFQ